MDMYSIHGALCSVTEKSPRVPLWLMGRGMESMLDV